jgi:flagellar motor protein MotB
MTPVKNYPVAKVMTPFKLPLKAGEIRVATILFANSSSSLSLRDKSILQNVRKLQMERGGRIRIVGHASSRTKNTDPVNHKLINLNVSVARAEAVAREFIRMGVQKSQLQVDAVSDSLPVYFEFMPSGEAGNRRAEIFLVS